jgi:SAM-dependent methyltransferase
MEAEKYFESRFKFDIDRVKVWKAISEYLQRFINSDKYSVLDIGCGYGDFINLIKAKNKFAIDLNPSSIDFIDTKTVTFNSQSVLEEFKLDNNTLDIVFASNLFEHFDDTELILLIRNIKQKLKSGGKLILIQPNIRYAYKEYWDDYTHKKAFSDVSLADFLVSEGFKITVVKKKFIPFSLKSKLPKSYWLTKCYLFSPIKPFAKQMLVIAEIKK